MVCHRKSGHTAKQRNRNRRYDPQAENIAYEPPILRHVNGLYLGMRVGSNLLRSLPQHHSSGFLYELDSRTDIKLSRNVIPTASLNDPLLIRSYSGRVQLNSGRFWNCTVLCLATSSGNSKTMRMCSYHVKVHTGNVQSSAHSSVICNFIYEVHCLNYIFAKVFVIIVTTALTIPKNNVVLGSPCK